MACGGSFGGKNAIWSVYNYVLNNPIMLVDPDGRAPGGPEITFIPVFKFAISVIKAVANYQGVNPTGGNVGTAPGGQNLESRKGNGSNMRVDVSPFTSSVRGVAKLNPRDMLSKQLLHDAEIFDESSEVIGTLKENVDAVKKTTISDS